jgi:glycosyltransferase involved in cell wall biosynthesis
MVTLANGLVARGYRIDLVLARAHGPFLEEVDRAVRLVALGTRSPLGGAYRLARYAQTSRTPVILFANILSNVAGILIRSLTGRPPRIVLREGSTLSMELPYERTHARRAVRFAARLAPRLYARADAIVTVSNGAADDLIEHFRIPREKIHCIYNPIITPELLASHDEPPPHAWYREKEPVVLAVGRLSTAKDYPTLLRAVARVRRNVPCRLIILGDGPDRDALGRLASELEISGVVDMPGFVQDPYPYMRQAGVFVLSSKWEGLPGTLIQALACGCPIVSTDCHSGPSEILRDGRYGELVEVGNGEQMATAIERALAGHRAEPVDSAWLMRFSAGPALDKYAEVLGLAPAESPPKSRQAPR